jgi:hypothetical protein
MEQEHETTVISLGLPTAAKLAHLLVAVLDAATPAPDVQF